MKLKILIGLISFSAFCFWAGSVCGSIFSDSSLLGNMTVVLFNIFGFLGAVGFLIAIYDSIQTKHTLWRNFPLFARGRWLAETLRPPIRQYFIESETDGTPIPRMFRSVIYQRSKKVKDTVPFGTQRDVYSIGYEWIGHSLTAIKVEDTEADIRVSVGSPACKQPYSSSIFNISAMSFGSLSKNAVLALNGGAKLGNFAHNTGEGGVSPYHLEPGGDLIWQVGTGYFGCRAKDGNFCPDSFREQSSVENIKMIELKLSQGAKPGHGGILPASKNTPEIAKIRKVEPYTQVDSPPGHRAFSTPIEMMEFIAQLRELSNGKPIGFKLCIGRPSEFVAICKAMVETGIRPDFIAVDGGEGGTGAAPLEYTNSVGMPYREGLAFVVDCLRGYDLKKDIKICASGKILSGFHLVRALALGADFAYSARAMMLALGCIQALECNKNNCPTGIATQDKNLSEGLVVSDKRVRVANYHRETVEAAKDLLSSTGNLNLDDLRREDIFRRVSAESVRTYEEIYPSVESGSFLAGEPSKFAATIKQASSARF